MKTSMAILMVLMSGAFSYKPALAQQGEDPGAVEGDVYPQDEGVDEGTGGEDVDITYFFDKLAPYGEWIWTPDYGWVWQPRGVWSDWRPYTYGRWAYTSYGWTWSSYFRWGWGPFHYGSWAFLDEMGWIWVPGTVWAPAWVMWRYSDAYIGWAPILAGYGFWYGWAYYPVYYNHWTFIGWHHFCDSHPHHHYLPRGRVYDAFRHTYYPRRCRNQSGVDCQRGPDQKMVSARSNQPVKMMKVQNLVSTNPKRLDAKMSLGVDRDVLKIYRPRFKPGPQRMEISGKLNGIKRSKDFGPVREFSKPRINRPSTGFESRPPSRMNPPAVNTQSDRLFRQERPFPGKVIHPKQPKIRQPSFSRPAIDNSGPRIRMNRPAPSRTNMRSTPQMRSMPRMKSSPKMRFPSRSSSSSHSSRSSGRSSKRK